MAKSKFKIKKDETKVDTPIKPDEVTPDVVEPQKEMEETEKTVIGLAEAEQLQKAGWQLQSVILTSQGKEYKFKKGK